MFYQSSENVFKAIVIIFSLIMVSACGSSRPYTLEPIKTFDPDNKDIPPPAETKEHFRWETMYLSTFYQLEKPLDIGNSFRSLGHWMGLNDADQAKNVNVLDEVPNSSWYTRRHYFAPMKASFLKQGPNKQRGPDTSQTIMVIRGKSEGITPGFTIKDARGNTFIIKLDNPEFPEMTSSSEVIVTLIYYASGYFTPQNSIAYLDPQQLLVGKDATVTKQGEKQKMTQADLDTMLAKAYKNQNGKIRALASRYVAGRPLGPWNFMGKRKSDPNDRIPHDDRREVRGLRVLASWLNDTDRRHANTLASYVTDGNRSYVRHYLLDMGSTLGTNGTSLRHTNRGQEYRYDLRYMALLYGTLGIYVKPWAKPEAKDRPFYPSVGYFESELFDPKNWVTTYPNPAFEKVTPRDGFWGAKMVMAFSDKDIRAIVEAAQISNPEAREYLIQMLIERKDKIGRYWFGQVNPLDKFKATLNNEKLTLTFSDLGVDGKLYSSSQTAYRYQVSSESTSLIAPQKTSSPMVEFDISKFTLNEQADPHILKVQIYTLRSGYVHPKKKIDIYIALHESQARVVGLSREG